MQGHEKLMKIPNYKLAASYSRQTKKRGGACVLVKNGLEYKELTEISRYSIANIFECCGIELVQQKILIICIYRPPKMNNLNIFYENLDAILKKCI